MNPREGKARWAEPFVYTGAKIETARRYRHIRTRNHYRVLHPIAIRESDQAPLVVYQRVDIENDATIWVRPLMEFLDRFEVAPPGEYAEAAQRPLKASED